MDILTERSTNIMQLALDGLMQRQKAISANIANAETPGYQRKEVSFESQLNNIMKAEDIQEQTKIANSTMSYVMTSFDQLDDGDSYLKSAYNNFSPEIKIDNSEVASSDGNNVNLESEMAELAKNGTKYTVISNLEGKKFSGMSELIKGAGQL